METIISLVVLSIGITILFILDRFYPNDTQGYMPLDNDDWREE